jgi:Cu2+-exporting ATPase
MGTHAPACRHCGAPLIDARMRESGFCCSGCSYVYRLVHEHGLAGYYRLKDAVTQPADTAVFEPRDYSWLAEAQCGAEKATGGPPALTLGLQGVSCAGCVWLIERLFQEQPGARDIFVNAQLGSMRIRWVVGRFSAVDFARKLQAFGYLAGPDDPLRAEPESRGLVVRVGLCAAFALNVMLFALPAYFGMDRSFAYAGLFGVLCLGFATLSFMVGGSYFLGRAWQALRMGVMHIDLPIAVGILGAYAGSLFGWLTGRPRFVYFDFVATFIFLMLVGRWAQVAAVERNRRRLLGRQPLVPRVRVVAGGSIREVRPEDLRPGETFRVPSGRTVPVASRMVSAEALFSLASINGESEPRILRAGQGVPAGAVNVGRDECEAESLETWKESLLARLLEPGERPGRRHAFLEKIVRGYLVGILVVAAASGIVWWARTGDASRTWSVVTAVLVVSCPCAIGLAFPLADEMATTALRRRGVFVRENDLYGKLPAVRRLVFDKTGTLTLETPALRNLAEIRDLDGDARSALLALVRDGAHPVSQCLLESLLGSGPVEPMPGAVRETIGFGLQLDSAGRQWSLGRPGWRGPGGTADAAPAGAGGLPQGDAEFACDGRIVARFHFTDTVRADARREVAEWVRRGYGVFILSGDRQEKVGRMADELGLPADHAVAGRGPREKARWLEKNEGASTLMLGDGANDSLAFDSALCRGTPVVHRGLLEGKADFYYLGRGIGGIRSLFEIGAMRRRTHTMILVFSVAYNLAAVSLAAAGRMSPLIAAILMPANSLATLALVSAGMRKAFR